MALQSAYTSTSTGAVVTDAYTKLDNININDNYVNCSLNIYANQESRNLEKQPVGSFNVVFPLARLDAAEGENTIEKAYNVVKSLDMTINTLENMQDV